MTPAAPACAKHRVAAAGKERRAGRHVDGIVLCDKPLGMTSNQALQRVRRLFAASKGGHTGSLDPLATGMLPICLGQATKVSAFLLGADKTYRFRICFGSQTTTGDAEGSVKRTGPDRVPEDELRRLLAAFHGDLTQVPPMYSALKHDGRRLYELARAGHEVTREPRRVHIYELSIEQFDFHRPVLRVRCGKGTYIRSLVEDIAQAAGTVAHVAELRRLTVAPFPETAMRTFEELKDAAAAGTVETFLVPLDEALRGLPAVRLSAPEALRIGHGQTIGDICDQPAGTLRLYDDAGRFIGLGERLPNGQIRPRRLMVQLTQSAKVNPGCN